MWKSDDLDSVYLYPTRRASEIQVSPLTKKVPKSKARPDLLEDKVIAWIPYSTSKEDRSLITAAPELLQSLKVLLQRLPEDPDSYEDAAAYRQVEDAVKRCKEVIQTITGEQS